MQKTSTAGNITSIPFSSNIRLFIVSNFEQVIHEDTV